MSVLAVLFNLKLNLKSARAWGYLLACFVGVWDIPFTAPFTHHTPSPPAVRPIQRGVLEFCGFSVLAPQIAYGPARAGDEVRAAALAAWQTRLATLLDEEPIVAGKYK